MAGFADACNQARNMKKMGYREATIRAFLRLEYPDWDTGEIEDVIEATEKTLPEVRREKETTWR